MMGRKNMKSYDSLNDDELYVKFNSLNDNDLLTIMMNQEHGTIKRLLDYQDGVHSKEIMKRFLHSIPEDLPAQSKILALSALPNTNDLYDNHDVNYDNLNDDQLFAIFPELDNAELLNLMLDKDIQTISRLLEYENGIHGKDIMKRFIESIPQDLPPQTKIQALSNFVMEKNEIKAYMGHEIGNMYLNEYAKTNAKEPLEQAKRFLLASLRDSFNGAEELQDTLLDKLSKLYETPAQFAEAKAMVSKAVIYGGKPASDTSYNSESLRRNSLFNSNKPSVSPNHANQNDDKNENKDTIKPSPNRRKSI
jgi:hypothetical protein